MTTTLSAQELNGRISYLPPHFVSLPYTRGVQIGEYRDFVETTFKACDRDGKIMGQWLAGILEVLPQVIGDQSTAATILMKATIRHVANNGTNPFANLAGKTDDIAVFIGNDTLRWPLAYRRLGRSASDKIVEYSSQLLPGTDMRTVYGELPEIQRFLAAAHDNLRHPERLPSFAEAVRNRIMAAANMPIEWLAASRR